MRFLFAALLALALGTGLTLMAQQDPGHVLLRYQGWSVETSLSLFLLGLVLCFGLFYLALRLLWGVWHMPVVLGRWQRQRRLLRAHRLTNSGLIALAEGNWQRAEKRLGRAAKRSDTPLINYLGAARAAQKLGAESRRDDYLAQASRSMPEAKLAIGLTQADLQLSQGQLEQALASLRELSRIAPRHVYVLHLLKKLYERLQSWEDLEQLLPLLRRHHVLQGEALAQFEQRLCLHLLGSAKNTEQLQQRWENCPKALRQQPILLQPYVQQLLHFSADDEAENQLQQFLRKHFDAGLIRLYGQQQSGDANAQLATLEHWLKEYPQHAELLLAAGRLSLRNQLWGKARSYLEASMGLDDRAETRRELAELLLRLDEREQALELYRGMGQNLLKGD